MQCDEIKREKTLEEEIKNLEVPQNVKERLLQKLKEEKYRTAAITYEKNNIMREEQNISLKNACFELAAALKQECKS